MTSGMLDGITIDNAPVREAERDSEDRGRRLAARLVRRKATAHGCKGTWQSCLDRNHRRDTYHAGFLAEALGLAGQALPTREDYELELSYAVMGPGEAELFR